MRGLTFLRIPPHNQSRKTISLDSQRPQIDHLDFDSSVTCHQNNDDSGHATWAP